MSVHREPLRAPGRRLGRRAPSNRPALRLAPLLTGVVPAHPTTADHVSPVRLWTLGANDRFSTCGPTMAANYVVMVYKILLGLDVTVSDAAVFDLYRRSGNPNFDPATDVDDNGVDLQTMLGAWAKGGIDVTHADGATETVTPVAFAKVNQANLDEVRAAISIFGGGLFGVDLKTAQQTQTDTGGPWDYVRSVEWGGHAVLAGRYRSTTKGADIDVISWRLVMGTTDAFALHQLEEAWVAILPAHLAHPAFQAGVDLATLAADYQAETGRTLPVPPVPTPTPPPPAPTPSPANPVVTFLRHLVAEIEAFLKSIGG